MHLKSKPDFEGCVSRARRSREINMIVMGVGFILALGGGVLSLLTPYWLFGILAAVLICAATAALFHKSQVEARAATQIARNSVYAAALDEKQQILVRKHQNRIGQRFYLTALLVLVAPPTLALMLLYFIMRQTAYLVVLGGFVLAALLILLLAMLYLNARLSMRNMLCLVSGRGIILGREILPFDSRKGEALTLLRFRNFYCIQFIKTAVFGIRYSADVIIPLDGGLRAGLSGTRDEELTEALGVDGAFVTDEDFYESRDYLGESEIETDKPQPGAESDTIIFPGRIE